jgi:SAM-dependent methyltransferase
MKPELLDPILACPYCRGRLERSADGWRCAADGRTFGRAGEAPVLFVEEDLKRFASRIEAAGQMKAEYKPGLGSRTKNLVKRAIGSTYHLPTSKTATDAWKTVESEFSLDVGSGTKSGSERQVNLDIGPFAGVDVIGSAERLPFADDAFSLVRSFAVLEHVRRPTAMIAEMHRVLRPGGFVYTEVPFLQHFHAYPDDFQRYTTEGLKEAFRAFEILEVGVCVGPSSTLTAIVADWFEMWSFSERRIVNDALRAIPLVLMLPVKYLDVFLMKNPRAHELASGVYVHARKPARA